MKIKLESDYLIDHEIYRRVLKEELPRTRKSLIIATALLKHTKL